MLELIDITKVYTGQKRAVDGVTMRLGAGLVGLLGPNGAGKSSLMRIAATVTRPTSGGCSSSGADVVAKPDSLRRALGYLPQDFGVYPNLTAREFLSYLAAVKGLSARSARARIDELLELVNLTEAAKRPLGKYSGGMLRRVGIAQTLLTDPKRAHRRRADRRAGPAGAGAVPQPAQRPRRGSGSAALHPHRLGHRVGGRRPRDRGAGTAALPRRTGRNCSRRVDGHVWEMVVDPTDVAQVQARAPGQPYGPHRCRRPGPAAVADPARPGRATPVPPDLEDAYLGVVRAAGIPGSRPR